MAQDGDAPERWRIGTETPGAQRLPLERLGRRLGWLLVPAGAALEGAEPLVTTTAALLLADAEAGESPARRGHVALLYAALAGADTFVWEWDIDSDWLSDIDEGLQLLGYPRHALPHTQDAWNALIHPEDRDANHEAFLRHARGETDTYEHTYRALDAQGQWRWLQERGRIVERHPDGRARRMLGTQTDVTARLEIENAAGRARAEAAAAAAANRAKTEFLSRMSHELRTPLNAVLGFTQLLEIDETEPATEGQRRRLKLIREAGEHLLQMIGDLLDLTRIEAGRLELRLAAVDVLAVAEETLAMLRDAAARAQVELALAPGARGLEVEADRTRLRHVLLNLVGNAIKYNRPGGRVEIRVWSPSEREVCIAVRDTGIGIAEAELPLLFEPFHRGAQSQGPVEGTGIGLAVTKALVQAMDGRIDVASTPGAGSTFTVTLVAVGG